MIENLQTGKTCIPESEDPDFEAYGDIVTKNIKSINNHFFICLIPNLYHNDI